MTTTTTKEQAQARRLQRVDWELSEALDSIGQDLDAIAAALCELSPRQRARLLPMLRDLATHADGVAAEVAGGG